MVTLLHPFISLGFLSAAVSLAVAVITWRQYESRGARNYAILMVLLAVWSLLYVLQLLQPTAATKQPWFSVRNGLSPLIAVLFWLFAARYTDRPELLSLRFLAPILVLGAVVATLPLVNPFDLFWTEFALYDRSEVARAQLTFGAGFWVFIGYIFAVVGGGHGYIVLQLRDSFAVYRRQLAAMAVVGVIELVILLLFLSDHTAVIPSLNPWPHLQLITYSMVLLVLPLGWSYFREALFDLQPLSRQVVVENMDDAVFVFDKNDHLRNSNVHARRLAGIDSAEGQPAAVVFDNRPTLLDIFRTHRDDSTPTESISDSTERLPGGTDALTTDRNSSTLLKLPVDGDSRYYDVRVSEIRNTADSLNGTVVVARDVTVRHRQREMLAEKNTELERQNERLDQFASVVSHDLRNPLQVADGKLAIVEETGDVDRVEDVRRTLDRMEEMIDDVLTLARSGRTIEDTTHVSLGGVASDAWAHADTSDCEFESAIPTETTVEADPDRLSQIFENLYRNAADHNDAPVTVRVGMIGDGDRPAEDDTRTGFFIEDTGDGIPDDRRDEIFEHGYTNSPDGTGLGLSIVQDIVEAHGWEIRATDGTDGGARFEVTGVSAEQ